MRSFLYEVLFWQSMCQQEQEQGTAAQTEHPIVTHALAVHNSIAWSQVCVSTLLVLLTLAHILHCKHSASTGASMNMSGAQFSILPSLISVTSTHTKAVMLTAQKGPHNTSYSGLYISDHRGRHVNASVSAWANIQRVGTRVLYSNSVTDLLCLVVCH